MGPGEAGPVTAWLARWPATITVLGAGLAVLLTVYLLRALC